jgi:trehalose-phosphatase
MAETNATDQLPVIEVGISDFWRDIGAAPHVALLLDYDGTLAPFHVNRLMAVPLDGVTDALQTIRDQTDTFVALVSGRPIAEILSLMPDPGVTIIGTHGFEIRPAGEDIRVAIVDEAQQDLLDRAELDAQKMVGKQRAERKIATVAAHFRGLDRLDAREYEQALAKRWLSYADLSLVEVRKFNGGLEMRALGRHKGVAVADYMATCPAGTLAVYLGDDDTDEDAFKVLRADGGYGIRVGEPSESTAAQGSLASCDDVLRFLQRWIKERANQ